MKEMFAAGLGCVALLAGGLASAESPANYRDPVYGFTLSTPVFAEGASNTTTTAVISMGAASDGFAPNVNVQVQRVGMSLDEFARISRDQFRQVGLTVHAEEQVELGTAQGLFWHYSGPMQGRELEIVAVAIRSGKDILLATGTATPEQFREVGPILRASVLSLRAPK